MSQKVETLKGWIKDLTAYFFLALLVTLKFWNFLIPKDKLYWVGDFLEVTSMRTYFYQNLRKGILILWNNYIGAGMPYLAADYGVFYPIDLLVGILFPNYFDPFRLSIIHALHFWLGGVFTYFYTRQLGFSRIPALASSICFMLGGFLLGHAGERNIITAYIWLPLILYFLDKALLQRRVVWAVWAGVCLAVSFLAGHPNFFYYILLFLACYFLFRVYENARERSWKKLTQDTVYFFILGLVCLGVSAIQLIPLLSTSINTHHGSLPYEWKAVFSFPLLNLVHFLIPGYSQWTATDIGEQYGYIGFLPLLFAFWGVFQIKDTRVKFFGLVAIFAFVASLGDRTPLFKFLYNFLPGLSQFRIPARFNSLIIFPLAILAGFGIHHFFQGASGEELKKSVKSIKSLFYLSLALGIGSMVAVGFILAQADRGGIPFGHWKNLTRYFLWFLLTWGVSYLLLSFGNRYLSLKRLKVSFIILISADLLLLARIDGAYTQSDPTSVSPQVQKKISEIKKDHSRFRISNTEKSLNSISSLMFYQNDISTYDLENLSGYVNTIVPIDYLEILFRTEKNPMLLDLLNVKYHIGIKPKMPNGLETYKIGGKYENKALELKGPTGISNLTVYSLLSYSASIPNGRTVARINLVKKDGSSEQVPVRAGIETSEWAIDRPGLNGLHQKAQVADSWDMPGEGYQGHSYVFSVFFPKPIEISKIGLQYLSDQGSLEIKKILINNREIDELLKDRFQLVAPNIYENNFSFPRVFMIGRGKPIGDEKEILKQMEQFDPRESVLLFHLPPGYHEPPDPSFSTEEAEIRYYSQDKIKIATNAKEDKFLVLSDTYDPFWKASIDHNPSPILRVDYGLRGIYVPKGNHQVEFSFPFFPFYLGLTVTLISLIGVLLFSLGVVRRNFQKRKREAH